MGAVETTFMRRLNVELKGRAISQPVYAEIVRGVLAHQTLAHRDDKVRAELPPESKPFVDEVTAEWLAWVAGAGIDVVGDLAELRVAVERRRVGRPGPARGRGWWPTSRSPRWPS